ncbi:MAG: TolB-like translocation protein, partial [Planctomycetota bacterium]
MGRLNPFWPALSLGVIFFVSGIKYAEAQETPLKRTKKITKLPIKTCKEMDYLQIAVSPDGRRIAWPVKKDRKSWVEIDGKESEHRFGRIRENSLLFCPDSETVVYIGTKVGGSVLVVNEKRIDQYMDILRGTPLFAPGDGRMAYGAKKGGSWVMVVGGREEGGYDAILEGS